MANAGQSWATGLLFFLKTGYLNEVLVVSVNRQFQALEIQKLDIYKEIILPALQFCQPKRVYSKQKIACWKRYKYWREKIILFCRLQPEEPEIKCVKHINYTYKANIN